MSKKFLKKNPVIKFDDLSWVCLLMKSRRELVLIASASGKGLFCSLEEADNELYVLMMLSIQG